MANSIQAKVTGFAAIMPKAAAGKIEEYQKVYASNRNRVYSFAPVGKANGRCDDCQ